LRDLIPTEKRQLRRGDIPAFFGRPGSKDLFSADGERFPEFFEETTLEHAERLITSLSEADLERQLTTVRASLQAARLSTTEVPRPTYHLVLRDQPVSSDELLAGAVSIGHQLADRAFTSSQEAQWLALDHQPHRGWCLVPAGPDFYQGLPGVIFFYAYLGALSGEPRFPSLARLALRTLDQQIEQGDHPLEGLGAYSGWSGLLYTFTHLSVLWGDASLLDRAERLASDLLPKASTDELLDLVAGSAGCLITSLRAYQVRPSAIFRELAVACGERLLATLQPQEHGAGWVVELTGPRPIAGISHGAAGISWALLELWGETGDERYREAARQGIEMERHLFSEERGNWPDLRVGHPEDQGIDGSEGQHFMAAWCHGAPGIGLARILGLPFLDDAKTREEIALAVKTTLDEGLGLNHSLCHGDLGNLDFLHRAALASGDEPLQQRALRLAGGVLDNLRREGPLCSLPRGSDPPSLMLGLAGIGYGLARLAAPDHIPSVLALDPIPGARP
jgi:type 2 lantibiotic biosynthesis protein LanM